MSAINLKDGKVTSDVSLTVDENQARALLALGIYFRAGNIESFLRATVPTEEGKHFDGHQLSLHEFFEFVRTELPDAIKRIEDARRVLTGQVSLPAAPRAVSAPTASKQPDPAT